MSTDARLRFIVPPPPKMSKRSAAAAADDDEAPWAKVQRSDYHRRRYKPVPSRPIDMTTASQRWSFDDPRACRDAWLHVWRRLDSFADLATCARVCKQWRQQLVTSDNDEELWGIDDVRGEWMVTLAPVLAEYVRRQHVDVFQRNTIRRHKRDVFANAFNTKQPIDMVLPQFEQQIRPPSHRTGETMVRVLTRIWPSPAAWLGAAQQRRIVAIRRLQRSRALSNRRRRVFRTLNASFYNDVQLRQYADPIVVEMSIAYTRDGEAALPRALAANVGNLDAVPMKQHILRWRRVITREMLRRYSRTLLRASSPWSRSQRPRFPVIGVYEMLFDWALVRALGDDYDDEIDDALHAAYATTIEPDIAPLDVREPSPPV